MARLLRTTMKNFNIHERVSTSLTNVECLPVAQILSFGFYMKLILIYFLILLFMWKGNHILSLRRFICLSFFPKREKERIQFLYGCVLRNRKSAHMDILRTMAEKNLGKEHVAGNVNIFMVLYTYFPDKMSCLKDRDCTKCRCLICHVLEDDKFVRCPKCDYPYCEACCESMNRYCLFCQNYIKEKKKEKDQKEKNEDKVEGKKKTVPETDGANLDLYVMMNKQKEY